jgi:hypothetical protein
LLLAVPLCSAGVRGAITTTPMWHDLVRLQALIVAASTIVSLFFLWLQRPKHISADKRHH